ncbi:hypothetical protein HUK65_18545 [Rhodobacteraceae bacterium 2376]|uniref:Uncharacterized protein n=1 Tax=Rhabdonatronobacter sediminivivens TaxID=2743469 RepID=A0A7Z0KZP4_9RHOB|nr:hypothetical protein [Rhabdonatronobacter sediminivivens]
MKLKVRDIVGLPGMPGTKRRALDWLKRSELSYVKIGDTFYFRSPRKIALALRPG